MRGHRCLVEARGALARLVTTRNPGRPRDAPAPLRQWATHASSTPRPPLALATQQPRRHLTSTAATHRRRMADYLEDQRRALETEEKLDRRYTMSDYMEKTGRDRLPWDHEITDPKIMVLDDGSVEGPLPTDFVLSKLNEGESLRMVQTYAPPRGDDQPERFALCKVVDRAEEYRLDKERRDRKRRSAKPRTKEVELSWGIGEHDLATKTRQITGFLAKGARVELVMGKKKGGRQVSDSEARAVLARLRADVEASGGSESKPPQGDVGGVLRLYLERKTTSKTA